jgi:hypothetical protein
MDVIRSTVRILVLVALLSWATGCATQRQGPTEDQIDPFSEHTIAMAAELHFGLQQADALLTRKFSEDEDSPRFNEFVATRDEVNQALRAIVLYSIEVVDLAESDPGEGVTAILADFVQNMASDIRQLPGAQPYLTKLDYNQQIATIRAQERLPDGLYAAQPIIDDIAGIVEAMLFQLSDNLVAATVEIDGEIQAEHAAVLRHRSILVRRQARVLEQLELVDEARQGNESAWSELLGNDEELQTAVGARGTRTVETLEKVETMLVNRLDTVSAISSNIKPGYELYLSRSRELQQRRVEGLDGARRSRIAVVLWARVHRRFARGDTSPSGLRAIYAALLGFAVSQGVP